MYGDVVLGLKPESAKEEDPFEVVIEKKKHALASSWTPSSAPST